MVACTLARLATSGGLSAPAGAPIFSATLGEAQARSRQFFREVRKSKELELSDATLFLSSPAWRGPCIRVFWGLGGVGRGVCVGGVGRRRAR